MSLRSTAILQSIVGATMFVVIAIPASLDAQTPSDSTAVAAAVRAYHAALAADDSASALDLLADDATILESGRIESRAHYRSGHLRSDMQFAQAVSRESGPIHVVMQGDVAWAISESVATGEFRDREVNSTSVELMVLTRAPGGWKIRAIHWSSRRMRPG